MVIIYYVLFTCHMSSTSHSLQFSGDTLHILHVISLKGIGEIQTQCETIWCHSAWVHATERVYHFKHAYFDVRQCPFMAAAGVQ